MSGPTLDVQTYDYVTDAGERIVCLYEAQGEVRQNRNVDVTIMVDGVCRLHSSDHFGCPADIPLGEFILHAVLRCLHRHMQDIYHALILSPYEDELVATPRHITELTKDQSLWWAKHPDVFIHLYNQSYAAAEEAAKKWPQIAVSPSEQEG